MKRLFGLSVVPILLIACGSSSNPPHAWLTSHGDEVGPFTNALQNVADDLTSLSKGVVNGNVKTADVAKFEKDCTTLATQIPVAQGWHIPPAPSGSHVAQDDLGRLVKDGFTFVHSCVPLETATSSSQSLSALNALDGNEQVVQSDFSAWINTLK